MEEGSAPLVRIMRILGGGFSPPLSDSCYTGKRPSYELAKLGDKKRTLLSMLLSIEDKYYNSMLAFSFALCFHMYNSSKQIIARS